MKVHKMRRFLLNICMLSLAVVTADCLAQNGPRVPACDGCPISQTERPYPRAGMWWDPARDGTGMNLEAQNGVVVGTWHGFDEDGSPIWYQFAGRLEPTEESEEGYWSVEAPLAEFVGGSCLGCPYQESEVAGVRGTIKMTVVQRNLISYQIDGGEEYRMQPLVWGTPMPNHFPEASDHGQPMFPQDEQVSEWSLGDGMTPWVLISRVPNPPPGGYITSSAVYWARSGLSSGTSEPWMSFVQQLGNELYIPVHLVCGSPDDNFLFSLPDGLLESLGEDPLCMMRRVVGNGEFEYFVTPLGNVGDDYFILTGEDGSVVEGHRLLYR